jgi:hypothetical protein
MNHARESLIGDWIVPSAGTIIEVAHCDFEGQSNVDDK